MNKVPDYQRMSANDLCEILTTTVGGPLACQAAERIKSLYSQLELRGDCKLPVGEGLEIFGKAEAIEQMRGLIVEFQRLQAENAEQKKTIQEAVNATRMLDDSSKEVAKQRDDLQAEVERLRSVGAVHQGEAINTNPPLEAQDEPL